MSAEGAPVDQPLKWMDNPGEEWLKKFAAFTCPEGKGSAPVADIKDQPLITCDDHGVKYLLSASMIQGTQLTKAEAGIPSQQVQWVVDLTFDKTARATFADVTRPIVNATSPITGQQKQFAIVLDGQVISAPVVNGVIPNGQAQISGDFTQTEAQTLANSLKYGALPLTFTAPSVSEEGPTLAADQLLRRSLGRRHRPVPGDRLLLPRPPAASGSSWSRVARSGRHRDLRGGALDEPGGQLHADPAGHRRSDRGGRHHRRLVHRLLRTHT